MRKWANKAMQFKLLECAHAQGHGRASYELGGVLDVLANAQRLVPPSTTPQEQFARALQILHDGTKFGSEDAANSLSSSFFAGDPLVHHFIDPARGQRYSVLGDALWLNPDLRFPNLDKVLPLPPAQLPQWDGKPKSLINAAKGVRLAPQPVTTSAHQLPPQNRAHIPPGHGLQVPAGLAHLTRTPLAGIPSVWLGGRYSSDLARAPHTGYWQVRVRPAQPHDQPFTTHLRREFAQLPPLRFKEGEFMRLGIGNSDLPHEDWVHSLVDWHFVGVAAPQALPQDWLAQAGTVRAIASATRTTCASGQPCPQSGIWQPYALDKAHPLAHLLSTASLNETWKRQAFVPQGERMPSLSEQGWPIEDDQVGWWLMQATALGFEV